MTELSVDARLDATICTNEKTRSYIKVGISINGIDPNGDVESQLQQGLETGRATLRVINDGIVEEVSNAITVADNPTLIVDQIGDLVTRIDKVESVNARVVAKVRELMADVKILPAAKGATDAAPAKAVKAKPASAPPAAVEVEPEAEVEAEEEAKSQVDELGVLPFDTPETAQPKKAQGKAKAAAAK